MNSRQRMIETLTFGRPDRPPFLPGNPRESTLKAWRTQGLPPDGDYLAVLHETLGLPPPPPPAPDAGLDFRMIPQFEEKVLDHCDGHYVVQDWKGNVCEIADTFDVTYLRFARDFVTRRWLKCPVETRDDWEQMKRRYDVNSPGRFPADFADRCAKLRTREVFWNVPFSGPFWQMREWCGFEGLCMMMIDQPDLVADMAAFYERFIAALLDRLFAAAPPDAIHICEDMAYKQKSMISPAMVREFCMPSWKRWSAQARAASVPVVMLDSDGFVGELVPLWVESGVNCCDPVEVAAGNDVPEMRCRFGRAMSYVGGVDKRLIAKGGQAIRDELRRIEPVVRDGGYIPSCDHGVPPDISWPNFVEYSRLVAKMTGWL